MNDPIDETMREVWEWKRQDEEATRGMTRAELIEYYRSGADEIERRWGLHLRKANVSDATKTPEAG